MTSLWNYQRKNAVHLKSGVVLDLVNKEVLKCEVPGQPDLVDHIAFETLYKHFYKAYGEMIDKFIK